MEIVGIPEDVNDKELELKVCEIFESIDVNICSDEMEACHRLPYSKKEDRSKPKRTIVKFVNRKKCEQAIFNRKKLKDVDKTKLKFPEETRIFINDSLCPYYRGIYGKCKKLYQLKNILMLYFYCFVDIFKLCDIIYCSEISFQDFILSFFENIGYYHRRKT